MCLDEPGGFQIIHRGRGWCFASLSDSETVYFFCLVAHGGFLLAALPALVLAVDAAVQVSVDASDDGFAAGKVDFADLAAELGTGGVAQIAEEICFVGILLNVRVFGIVAHELHDAAGFFDVLGLHGCGGDGVIDDLFDAVFLSVDLAFFSHFVLPFLLRLSAGCLFL